MLLQTAFFFPKREREEEYNDMGILLSLFLSLRTPSRSEFVRSGPSKVRRGGRPKLLKGLHYARAPAVDKI
jgi:hypothetical protein